MLPALLYRTPPMDVALAGRLAELDGLRARLAAETGGGSPWLGMLRRVVRAAAVESSTSIEGFAVGQGQALAIVAGTLAAGTDDDRLAIECYARAMDHVGVLALDPWFVWSERVILDLHFDACAFQRDMSPGLLRTGPISVTDGGGGIAYEAPPARDVRPLVAELVDWLERGDLGAHVVVRAAMAHLHAVSIHPFRDGNGRTSRILQSLVLARDGLVSAEFASIEEYLGEHTPAYYAVLQQVQGGQYRPERDASAWVDCCVDAHLAQALRRLEQIAMAAARWALLETIVGGRGWPDRLAIALEQALMGGVDRASYCREAGIAAPTASIDLRRLVDAGLVTARGRGRSVRYHATAALAARVGEAVAAARGGPRSAT